LTTLGNGYTERNQHSSCAKDDEFGAEPVQAIPGEESPDPRRKLDRRTHPSPREDAEPRWFHPGVSEASSCNERTGDTGVSMTCM